MPKGLEIIKCPKIAPFGCLGGNSEKNPFHPPRRDFDNSQVTRSIIRHVYFHSSNFKGLSWNVINVVAM